MKTDGSLLFPNNHATILCYVWEWNPTSSAQCVYFCSRLKPIGNYTNHLFLPTLYIILTITINCFPQQQIVHYSGECVFRETWTNLLLLFQWACMLLLKVLTSALVLSSCLRLVPLLVSCLHAFDCSSVWTSRGILVACTKLSFIFISSGWGLGQVSSSCERGNEHLH